MLLGSLFFSFSCTSSRILSVVCTQFPIFPEKMVTTWSFTLSTIVGRESVASWLGNTVRNVYIEPTCYAFLISGKNSEADSINFEKFVMGGFFTIPLLSRNLNSSGIMGCSPMLLV